MVKKHKLVYVTMLICLCILDTLMFFSVWSRRAIAILPLFSLFSRKLWPFRIKRIGPALYVTHSRKLIDVLMLT